MHGMQQPAHTKGAPTQELPTLIQQTIRKLINSAPSPELAIRHMQVILQNNKSLDPQLTDFIIKQLALKFTPDNDIFFTALMLGTDSAIDWLITHYAQTKDKIKGLIFVALQAQIPQVVFKLIDRFPQLAQEEFEYQNPRGEKETSTFMIEAIAKEDIPLIKKLLSVGFDPNKKREGQTPYLLWIMDKNNLEMIKMYLDAGANPNLTDEFGVTPLMRAVTHGNVDAVELLLRYNADKSLVNEWGETALSSSKRKNHE